MDTKTRIEIVELFYVNSRSPSATLRAFKTKHKLVHNPFDVRSVSRLMEKFEKTGSIHDIQRSGRPSLVEDRSERVEEALQELKDEHEFGVACSTHVAAATGIPQTSVWRILRQHLNLYPYRLQTTQALTSEDKVRRIEFANFILNDATILNNVLWSDEAYFSLSGHVHRHNCIIWGSERPMETYPVMQHSPKILVWFGFSKTYRLTPYFFEDTMNGDDYKTMLENHVFPQLRRLRKTNQVVFQHDGAPPHFARVTTDFLKSILPENRIIAREFPRRWPPRSPDISPLDYYFWGVVKSRVYFNYRPHTMDDLRNRITEVIRDVDQEELQRAIQHLLPRLECVINNDGGAIENKF